MLKWWDVKPPMSAQEYQITRWLEQVSNGGIVGNKAVLVCYNRMHPARSILIVEDIQI